MPSVSDLVVYDQCVIDEIKFAPRICDVAIIHWPGTEAHRTIRLLEPELDELAFNELDQGGTPLGRQLILRPTTLVVTLEEIKRDDFGQVWSSERDMESIDDHWEMPD